MKKLKNFFNPVLPLVFDDSLSMYELLSKVIHKINEVIDYVNVETSKQLQKYIDEHFDEIMVDAVYNADTETIEFTKGVR